MIFQSNYNRTYHSAPEMNYGPTLVVDEGYLSTQELIELMVREGQELVAARKEMHDFPPEVPIDETLPLDPTRQPGYDLADASQALLELEQRAAAATASAPKPEPEPPAAPGQAPAQA